MGLDRASSHAAGRFRRSCLAAFVLSFASATQAVEFAGGLGTAGAPYQIATAEQLIAIGDDSTLLSKYFVLVDDIDLDPNLPGGQIFTRAVLAFDDDPYHGAAVGYSGRFYGQGHKIRHLTINAAGMQRVGLFGRIAPTGRVYDLALEDVRIAAVDHAGGLAGLNEGGLTNCSVTGSIHGSDQASWLGGMVAVNLGTLLACRAEVAVTAGQGGLMLGLLAGMHRGGIADCIAVGELGCGAGGLYLGGLAGACIGGIIRDSHAGGRIVAGDGSWGLGGLAGRADAESTVANSSADVAITVDARGHELGGLIGTCFGVEIDNCVASGAVTGGPASYNLGGLLGSCLGIAVRNCCATGAISGYQRLGGFVGCVRTGTSMVQCYSAGRILRGSEPWGQGGFAGGVDRSPDVRLTGCFWGIEDSGAKTSAGGAGLTALQTRDPTIFRAAGWDLFGDSTDGAADLWFMPPGGVHPVLATFSGQVRLHKLKGAGTSSDPYVIATPQDLGAIGRYNPSAWYRLAADIDLSGVTWASPPVATFAGVLDGRGHRIAHLTLRGSGSERVGFIGRIAPGGWVFDLALDDIAVDVPTGMIGTGGLAGENAGNVLRCHVNGRIVSGESCRNLGGLIGVNRLGVIEDCYTVVEMRASGAGSQIGGLIGYDYMGTIANCYAAGSVSGGSGSFLGALLGRSSEHATATSCYFLDSPDGDATSGAGTPVTAEQMAQQATFVDWDFRNVWTLCGGNGYPRLRWELIDCTQ